MPERKWKRSVTFKGDRPKPADKSQPRLSAGTSSPVLNSLWPLIKKKGLHKENIYKYPREGSKDLKIKQ